MGWEHIDTDELIEKDTGQSIKSIFKNFGERYFRRLERNLAKKLSSRENNLIISTGAKTLLEEESYNLLSRTGVILCLWDEPENIWPRLKDKATRPLLQEMDIDGFVRLFKEREGHYRNMPNKIRITGLSIDGVVKKIENFLNHKVSELEVVTGGRKTKVILRRFVNWKKDDLLPGDKRQVFLVSDRGVILFVQQVFLMENLPHFFIKGTDKNKTLLQAEKLWQWLLNNGVKRDSILLSVGGGVTGDLCGFVAATILRGIEHYHIPSTLLAMVDSCIGGKNGINLGKMKNCLGTFYAPGLVVINPLLLYSLKWEELSSGLTEAIKAGLIGDATLIDFIETRTHLIKRLDFGTLEEIIQRALAVKKEIVEKDAYESGLRKKLNLGHTMAHALEAYYEYKISHGQAVAVGLLYALKLSEELGLCPPEVRVRIKTLLESLGLRTMLKAQKNNLLELMKNDKKQTGDGLDLVLWSLNEGAVLRRNVDRNLMMDSMKEVIIEDTHC